MHVEVVVLNRVPNKGFTHGGVFHADDVFATALLTMVNPDFRAERGYCVPEEFHGIVYDMGGGEFDHHGPTARIRANGVPYASFGLLWECFGTILLDEENARAFDESFVQPIDDADNGGRLCMLSQLVSDFNPIHSSEANAYDEAFNDAVAWALGVLQRRIEALWHARDQREYVFERMRECDGYVLVLDRPVPWKKAVIGSGYVYVVYPSVRDGYNVQAVPKRLGDHGVLLPFPEAWRGLPAEELRGLTGVEGMTFCHPSGFLCAASTLSAALDIARLSLAGGKVSNLQLPVQS